MLVGLTATAGLVGWTATVGTALAVDASGRAWLRENYRYLLVVDVACIVGGVLAWLVAERHRPIPEVVRRARLHDLDTFDGLCAWLENDDSIEHPQADAFAHASIAKRIARRLASGTHRKPPTIAVLGKNGSGKTSILNLVRADMANGLGDPTRVRLVPVSVWPYETVEAAVAGILNELVTAIHREVGVPGLRGLPAEYVKIIEGSHGFWGNLVSFLRGPTTPRATVQRLDEVAEALELNFVVWVEDLERFADRPEAGEVLGPIRALFHLLDASKSLSLVLATKRVYAEFDLDKLVRYIELVPELPAQQASRMLQLFRTGCLAQLDDRVDPAPASARKALNKLGESPDEYAPWFGSNLEEPAAALANLCATPRGFKFAMRRCLETWRALGGEIDFDDVLVISMVREAEPEVFAALLTHVGDLRGMGRFEREEEKRKSTFSVALEEIEPQRLPREGIQGLVNFVFPESAARKNEKPQGMCHAVPRDYWARFLALPELSEFERDQPILAICFGDDEHGIVAALSDHRRSAVAGHFLSYMTAQKVTRMTAERLTTMLSIVIEQRASEKGSEWPDRSPPGLTSIWALMRARADAGERAQAPLRNVLVQAIASHTARNLQLVEQSEYWFAWEDKVPSLLGQEGTDFRQEVRTLVETLLAQLPDDARGQFADGVARSDSWALCRIVNRRLVGSGQSSTSLPWAQWPTLAEILLDVAGRWPGKILPALAALVVRETDSLGYEYDRARSEWLFGHDRLISVFQGDELSDSPGLPAYNAVRRVAVSDVASR